MLTALKDGLGVGYESGSQFSVFENIPISEVYGKSSGLGKVGIAVGNAAGELVSALTLGIVPALKSGMFNSYTYDIEKIVDGEISRELGGVAGGVDKYFMSGVDGSGDDVYFDLEDCNWRYSHGGGVADVDVSKVVLDGGKYENGENEKKGESGGLEKEVGAGNKVKNRDKPHASDSKYKPHASEKNSVAENYNDGSSKGDEVERTDVKRIEYKGEDVIDLYLEKGNVYTVDPDGNVYTGNKNETRGPESSGDGGLEREVGAETYDVETGGSRDGFREGTSGKKSSNSDVYVPRVDKSDSKYRVFVTDNDMVIGYHDGDLSSLPPTLMSAVDVMRSKKVEDREPFIDKETGRIVDFGVPSIYE